MAFAQSARSIPGAVATLGVSDRITFLRKTYAHLGGALLVFAALTGGMLKYAPEFSWKFTTMFGTSMFAMLAMMVLMMVGLWVAERWVRSSTSRGVQYAGLGLGVAIYAFLFQPIFWVLMLKFSHYNVEQIALIRSGHMVPVLNGPAMEILTQAIAITLAIFVGLTLVVFISKKDFSFMRGILTIASFGAIGMIFAAIIFGFTLGAFFAGFMILLMAGYILFQTSAIMKDFPPTAYIAAAMMLFSTVVTLFWYVLRLIMSLRSD
ncbi:MAG: Bax inhibitor-1 family protein [Kofleriaceae bacterium]